MKNLQKYCLLLLLLGMPIMAIAQEAKLSREERRAAKEERQAARQQARIERDKQKQADWERKHAPTEADVVYIFGVGTNFNDSTVYLTDAQAVTHLRLTKKYKFLPYRADFSEQFREYLTEHYELAHETTCVFYAKKRNTLVKHLNKLKKRYLNMGISQLIMVTQDDFRFQKPDYEYDSF